MYVTDRVGLREEMWPGVGGLDRSCLKTGMDLLAIAWVRVWVWIVLGFLKNYLMNHQCEKLRQI